MREAVGIAAYRCGDWAQALAELRAARRLGSKSPLLPLIADCERGLGRPERAIELARSPEAAQLTGDDADELRIVVAAHDPTWDRSSRRLPFWSTPQLDPTRTGQTAARLFYAYAETLLARPGARGSAVVHQRRSCRCRGRDRCRRADHGAHLT